MSAWYYVLTLVIAVPGAAVSIFTLVERARKRKHE
jgi:hypothetical protein